VCVSLSPTNQSAPRHFSTSRRKKIMNRSSLLASTAAMAALLASPPSSASPAPQVAAVVQMGTPPIAPHGIPKFIEPPGGTPRQSVPPIAAKWASAWNRCDATDMAALFTDDAVYDDFAFQARSNGKAGILAWVRLTCSHLVGAHAEIVDTFQTGNRVAIRWIFSGAPAKGSPMPATGQSFAVPVMTVLEIDGDRIRYDGDYYNLADLFRQLGIPAGPWVPPTP
jgi:steroid delta-isomerase-like uncharacterized protein